MITFEVDGIEYRYYDHLFSVSYCGKVLRKLAPYEPVLRNDGYLSLGRRGLMHRVVAICWLEKPEGSDHVHHKNGVRSDNRADNLEWISPKDHMGDRHKGACGYYERTDETRSKLSQYRWGKKDKEETRAKKAEALARLCPKTICSFQGIEYPSMAAAARAAGIKTVTFRVRCLSKNFPEYQIIKKYYDR